MKKQLILLTLLSCACCIIIITIILTAFTPVEINNQFVLLLIIVIIGTGCLTIFIMNKIVNKFLNSHKFLITFTKNFINDESETYEFKSPYIELQEVYQVFEKIKEILNNYKNNALLENKKTSIILNKINEGLLVLDKDQDVLLINTKARDILHCNMDMSNRNIVHYTDNPIILKNIDSAQKKHKKKIFDVFDQTTGKTYRYYISIVSEDAFNNNGDGMLLLIMDVTEIVKADQIRKDFTSNVNEQMKKPIEKIIDNLLKIKKNFKKDSETYKLLKKSLNDASSLRGIINDAILITELETLDNDINKIPVNLREIMENLIPYAESLSEDNKIKINIIGNADLTANPSRMRELIKNLITNAIKYNKEKGEVKIRFEDINNEIKIEVSDTGIGINPEEKERIFERFYRGQLKDKNQDDVPGTGLGLSIVKHICQLYGGQIDLKSTLGQGTDITVSLPKKRNK